MSSTTNDSGALTIIDGVRRSPATGISILIAGGGIGGMMTALESWRQGHDVRILERNPEFDMLGDCLGILPPAWTTLRFFPTMKQQFEAESYDALWSFWRFEGRKLLEPGEASWNQPGAVPHPAKDVRVPWMETRIAIARMLEGQCQRLGIKIDYGKTVVDYDEDEKNGIVKVQDANGKIEAETADIVVAADGVGTRSHIHVTGEELKAESSGYAVYRGLIPMDVLQKNLSERIRERFFSAARPEFRLYLAHDLHANFIITKDFVCYVITYPDNARARESWKSSVSAETVLKTLAGCPGWDPDLLEIFSHIPSGSCVDWTLIWRDPQPNWTSVGGRVVQLGDTAHAFLPTSGNGATQAIEDALSLATCLRVAGKGREHIATKVHGKLRFERVSLLQQSGFVHRKFMHHVDLDAAEADPSIITLSHPEWVWAHNPVDYAIQNYALAEKHVLEGAEFHNTNVPPGFVYQPWTIAGEMEKERADVEAKEREKLGGK